MEVINLRRKFEYYEDEDGDADDEEIEDALNADRVLPVPCGADIKCNFQCEECMIPGRRYTIKELAEHERQKYSTEQEMLDEIDKYEIIPYNRNITNNPNWIWS